MSAAPFAHAEDVETVEAEHESAASTSSPAPSPPVAEPKAQPMRSSKLRPFKSPRTPSATMPSRTVKRPTSAQEIGDEYHPGLCLDGILYDLTIDRLSGKICTFAHVTSVFFATSKVTKEAEILQEGFSLILCGEKNFYRTAIFSNIISLVYPDYS